MEKCSRPTPKVSSSSEAKDLGAINISVASEILRFAQNDGGWRKYRLYTCILVYSPASIPFHSSLFAFPLLRWLPPGGSWRRQATEGECATLSLRVHIVRRLLPPLTRSPSLPEGGSVILLHFAVYVNAVLRPTPKFFSTLA